MTVEAKRPTLFAEENRELWMIVRRFLIYLLHELDRWYGCTTFKK